MRSDETADDLQREKERLIAIEQQRMSDDWWTELIARSVAVGIGAGLIWGLWEIFS